MLTAFILGIILFFIYLFFYEQTAVQYRINQVAYSSYKNSLLMEQEPIVITDVPKCPIWTIEDIKQRSLDIRKKPINILDRPPSLADARHLGNKIGSEVWLEKILKDNILAAIAMKEIRATWGRRGLQPVHTWTAVILTEGTAVLSLLHKKTDKFLPANWKGLHPADLSRSHTPFLEDVKFIDIILRPGTVLLVPPHWRMSIAPEEESGLALEVAFHHPMSLLMGAVRGY
jgi:hypothetical protein